MEFLHCLEMKKIWLFSMSLNSRTSLAIVQEKHGRAEGNCASGFGICCVFTKETCGEKVNQNSTYIRNEDYPTAVTTAGTCEYEVEKCDENVCTLRLDFEEFTLDSWAATASDDSGYICSDTFVVSDLDTGAVVPTICGENTGQHMFIDLGKGSTSGAKLEIKSKKDRNKNKNLK